MSKANPWIQLRLQLGPATSRRHLTGNKCSEMSPTPALCQSGSTPWRPLFSQDCSPQVSCSHDFHCPVCACACTCVLAPACPLAQTPPLSCARMLTTPGVLSALKKYSSRGLRPRGGTTPPPCPLPSSDLTNNVSPQAPVLTAPPQPRIALEPGSSPTFPALTNWTLSPSPPIHPQLSVPISVLCCFATLGLPVTEAGS